MQIVITVLLFGVFAVHKYFIDPKKVEQVDSFILSSRYPWALYVLLSLLFFGYIVLWVFLCSHFTIWVDNLLFGY